MLGPMLPRFKKIAQTTYNFRCPYCGDSRKSRTKARGFVYKNKHGSLSFECKNCGEYHGFETFLKNNSQTLFSEYLLEKMSSRGKVVPKIEEEPTSPVYLNKKTERFFEQAVPVINSPLAYEYVKSRQIPKSKWDRLYYTYDYNQFLQSLGFSTKVEAVPRLLIPEFRNNQLVWFTGRTINEGNLRYDIVKVDDEFDGIYGLSSLDFTKEIYVVEGPIDSLFIENSVAVGNSNLSKILKDDIRFQGATLIWDNEPKNLDICRKMKRAIDSGYRIVIFPKSVVGKDINQMVENGYEIGSIIKGNTFQGLRAKLEFGQWIQCDITFWKNQQNGKFNRN
jgi:transcription elongation factor Elf1